MPFYRPAWSMQKTAGAYKLMLLTGDARGAVGFYEKVGFTGHEKNGLIYRF